MDWAHMTTAAATATLADEQARQCERRGCILPVLGEQSRQQDFGFALASGQAVDATRIRRNSKECGYCRNASETAASAPA